MARITLEEIKETLQPEGWSVLSDQYQNLRTEMVFQCNEGHKVYTTWGKLREKVFCPTCQVNVYKNMAKEIDPKPKNGSRILALDQSTWRTGWSIFDSGKLTRYGLFVANLDDEAERFVEVKEWLTSMIQNWDPDVLGIEGIQYQKNFGVTTFQTLARLQGVLMALAVDLKIPLVIAPTASWRALCGVKGKARADRKKSMQLIVKEEFDVMVNDDCADAIGIGKYVSSKYSPNVEITSWE